VVLLGRRVLWELGGRRLSQAGDEGLEGLGGKGN
jgi:hypothetical protein